MPALAVSRRSAVFAHQHHVQQAKLVLLKAGLDRARSNWLFANSLQVGMHIVALMRLVQAAGISGHDR